MKTTATALGMLAAVASAYNPARHLHFPRANETESLTTMTVKATQVHTITSCAPTVTNCPVNATMVVTDTIVVATTVCPVGDVAKVSSSLLAKAPTTGPAPTTAVMTTEVIDIVTDKTLTMRIGTGSTASMTTTTIHSTSQKTITVPRTTDTTAAPSTTAESTTTLTATTKFTRTLTVSRAKPNPTGPAGNPDHSGKGDCPAGPAPTVTVTVVKETVTALASTVYVTVGACTTSAAEKEPIATTTPVSVKSSNDGDKSMGADKPHVSSDCPNSTTTLQATVTVVPYPAGNSTHTSGHANPTGTGFARLRR